MTLVVFTMAVGGAAFLAGMLGSMTGLGGGIVLVPVLTLVFGVDIRYAIGASLIAVIATSTGSTPPYLERGHTNIRIGALLEVATTTGALTGAFIATYLAPNLIAIVFAVVLLLSAAQSLMVGEPSIVATPDAMGRYLKLGGTYVSDTGPQRYEVRRVPLGFALMFIAGNVSALLGIGSGVVKVIAMDRVMGLPFKVSTTTSTFMIGVTAAASAGVYLHRGYIDPALSFPVIVGVLAGATRGSHLLHRASVKSLRLLFTVVVVALAIEMAYKALRGGF